MDQQVQKITPDYKRIFSDILRKKQPNQKKEISSMLQKSSFISLEIIKLNQAIFGKKSADDFTFNKRQRSYDLDTIIQILKFQKKGMFTHTEISRRFGISRNTISKWNKQFLLTD